MDAFGIFEGGGAKGLAHIGALKAAEENGVRFIGVAGTSAGAIVASLVAAGYTADELYLPGNKKSLFAFNFLDFFPERDWTNLMELKKQSLGVFTGRKSCFGIWRSLNWFLIRNNNRIRSVVERLGFLGTDQFEAWLDEKLRLKLLSGEPSGAVTGPNGKVAFRDLPIPLKVIASDIRNRRVRAFPSAPQGTESVAAAVAASISIPIVFMPQLTATEHLVDGGILSNFPAWVFDRERETSPPLTPTFGFRLVTSLVNQKQSEPFPQFLIDLFHTSVFGDNSLETRAVANLHQIPLRVRIGPLDFSMSPQTRDDIYRDGKNDARDYFQGKYVGPRDPADMKRILRTAHRAMQGEMGRQGHLRVNVMRPVDRNTLKVVYCHNMDSDDDYDDAIEFPKGRGACGLCWDRLDFVLCDLDDAKATYATRWRMTKHQQRLVRHNLKSLLSVPIFDQKAINGESRDSLDRAFLEF